MSVDFLIINDSHENTTVDVWDYFDQNRPVQIGIACQLGDGEEGSFSAKDIGDGTARVRWQKTGYAMTTDQYVTNNHAPYSIEP